MNRFSRRGNRLSGYPFMNSTVKLPGSATPITRGGIVTGTGTSLSVPSGLQEGDVLFVASINTNATCALPTGFTNGQNGNTNSVGYRWSYKRVTSSVDTTVAGLTSAANHWITYFRGVDKSVQMDVTAPTRGAGTTGSPDSPSVTPVTAGSLVISLAFRIVADSTCTEPTGFSDKQFTAFAARTINFASKIVSPAAATNPSAWTVGNTTAGWIAASIAFRPQYAFDGASIWDIRQCKKEYFQPGALLRYDFLNPASLNRYAANVYDLTTKQLTGVVTGGYTKSYNALTLNGTSGQLAAPLSKTILTSGFLIEGWMTFTNVSGSILSITGSAGVGTPFVYMRWVAGSGLSVYVNGGYNLSYGSVPTGVPVFFCIMYTDTAWKLFINGVCVSTYVSVEGGYTGFQMLIGNGYSGYYPVVLHRLEAYDFWANDQNILDIYTRQYRLYNKRLPGPEYTDPCNLHFNLGTDTISIDEYAIMELTDTASYKEDASLIGYVHMDGVAQSMSCASAKSELGSTFTISMSFATNVAAGRAFFSIANAIDNTTPWLMLYRDSGSTLSLYVNGAFNINTTIAITTWYALHITYDGTTWKLYLDGVLRASYVGSRGSNSGDTTYFGRGSSYGYCNVAFQQYKTRANTVLNELEIAKEAYAMLAATPLDTGV